MGLDDLKEVMEKLQGMINTRHDYLLGKERRTRQVLIDPLLKVLGWDVSDPGAVYIEHNWMDYALMLNATPVVVIEAKPFGESLEKKAITQAITYAIENNILYIIVTNGDRWEMYEVLKPGTMEDKKLMEFQLSEHLPQECVLQASRIWGLNFASGSPKKAVMPVPTDKREKAVPALPAGAPKHKGGRAPQTRLAVTMPNDEKIDHKTAKDTFVEVIDKLGVERVKNLNIVCNKWDLISDTRNPKYPDSDQPQLGVGGYYIMAATSTNDKKEILEDIASDLGVSLKVEIVLKG